jgi:hypothetical protein
MCLAVSANASTAIIGADSNVTPIVVFGATTFTTTGATMTGLQVTVNFEGGGSSTGFFATGCGDDCGSATGSAGSGTWTLAQTGNTGQVTSATNIDGTPLNYWTLTNTTGLTITSVDLLGGEVFGNVIFDRNRADFDTPIPAPSIQVGTPGSSFGITFQTTSSNAKPADSGDYTVTVTYRNIVQFHSGVACQGAAFTGRDTSSPSGGCGDAWQGVSFAFTGGPAFNGTVGTPTVFHFYQDTDEIGVPEPLTFGLMGAGLAAIALLRKRQISRRSS